MSIQIGDKFGRWTVIGNGGTNKYHQILWDCQCELFPSKSSQEQSQSSN